MIRVNLSIDEHAHPRLHRLLQDTPPRKRAGVLRRYLSVLEGSTVDVPSPAIETPHAPTHHPVGTALAEAFLP